MLKLDLEKINSLMEGRTQEAVAKEAQMSQPSLARILSGSNQDVRVSTLGKLAKALKKKPGELLAKES